LSEFELLISEFAWDVLGQHGNERQPKALIKIRDELVARHLFELAVVAEALLERQMPVHVVGIPPRVLQALPEEARLANAANFVTACDDAFLAVLAHQLAQRVDQFGLGVFEAFVVGAEVVRALVAFIPRRGGRFYGLSRWVEA